MKSITIKPKPTLNGSTSKCKFAVSNPLHQYMTSRSFSTPKDINPKLVIRPEDDRLDVGVGTDFAEEYDGRIYVDLVRKNKKRRNQPVIDVESHFFPNQSLEELKTEIKK